MSPTPVDIDRAIEALRSEARDPEVTIRARRIILARSAKPKRAIRARWLVLAATAGVCALLLWPRGSSGVGWAQAVQATLETPNMVETSYAPNGDVAMISWRSGIKRATLGYTGKGDLFMENRTDGKRTVNFFNLFYRSPADVSPNARNFAIVWDGGAGAVTQFELPLQSIDALLRKPGVVVLSRTPSTTNENIEEYRVHLPKPRDADLYADVDTATHRIQSVFDHPGGAKLILTYPDQIPDSTFEPRIQAAKGIESYDLTAQHADVRRTIAHGLGRQGPVTLRLVLLDCDGNLWAFWTGALPNRYLNPPIRLPGVRFKDPQGFKDFTTDHGKAAGAFPAPSIHQWLGGMAVTPESKLGETVDIDIPYKGGVAHFQRVPILRIGLLSYFREELGASHL